MSQSHSTPFPVTKPPELGGPGNAQSVYPVAIIGAGPIGLAAAIDLAQRGIASVVLDDNNVVSVGSRAICWAKRSLEIFERLGIGQKMLAKGVTWQVGRVFHGKNQVYEFNLLPEAGHQFPAFINLQQYYVEQYLVARCWDFPDLIDLRFKNRVTHHENKPDVVRLTIDTPDGPYQLDAGYLLACDGAKSPTRERMGLSFEGESFEEQFLIADVKMEQDPFDAPAPERWFWFDPPFHSGQSALLHKQPDDVYRIDLQLGPDADAEQERDHQSVMSRIKSIVGDKPFDLEWVSVYKFRCARLQQFVHDRVIFVGDSAHLVSPFGARGGNGGMHDVDNLGWKLASIIKGKASPLLLASYNRERGYGADENIQNSARATNFMTPKSEMESLLRNEVLGLARHYSFARRLINSGRLSVPCALFGAQHPAASAVGAVEVGVIAPDLPLQRGPQRYWLSSLLSGQFKAVSVDVGAELDVEGLEHIRVFSDSSANPSRALDFQCVEGHAATRYGTGFTYLVRPDGYIFASFAGLPDPAAVVQAVQGTQMASVSTTSDEVLA